MLRFVGRGKAASYRNKGSDGQRIVAYYIFNDGIGIMSTFEMNRFASLTYSETVCNEIYDMLEAVLNTPEEYSILTMQKILALMNHLVIHGAERCVLLTNNISDLLERMRSFNTAVQQQRMSFFSQLKGGAVDEAFAVRQMSKDLLALIRDKTKLEKLRMDSVDPSSLVPVGDGQSVGFAPTPSTAQEWMDEQKRKEQKQAPRSNLKKADSGFGGGCHINNDDGEDDDDNKKKIISAAHSLEEMMAKAREDEERRKNRYFDDPEKAKRWHDKVVRESGLDSAEEMLREQFQQQLNGLGLGGATETTTTNGDSNKNVAATDLLDFDLLGDSSGATSKSNAADVDLLSMNGTSGGAVEDLLGYSEGKSDLLATVSTPPILEMDLLNSGVDNESSGKVAPAAATNGYDPFDLLSPPAQDNTNKPKTLLDSTEASPVPIKPSIMGAGANPGLAAAMQMLDMTLPPGVPPPPPPPVLSNGFLGEEGRQQSTNYPISEEIPSVSLIMNNARGGGLELLPAPDESFGNAPDDADGPPPPLPSMPPPPPPPPAADETYSNNVDDDAALGHRAPSSTAYPALSMTPPQVALPAPNETQNRKDSMTSASNLDDKQMMFSDQMAMQRYFQQQQQEIMEAQAKIMSSAPSLDPGQMMQMMQQQQQRMTELIQQMAKMSASQMNNDASGKTLSSNQSSKAMNAVTLDASTDSPTVADTLISKTETTSSTSTTTLTTASDGSHTVQKFTQQEERHQTVSSRGGSRPATPPKEQNQVKGEGKLINDVPVGAKESIALTPERTMTQNMGMSSMGSEMGFGSMSSMGMGGPGMGIGMRLPMGQNGGDDDVMGGRSNTTMSPRFTSSARW